MTTQYPIYLFKKGVTMKYKLLIIDDEEMILRMLKCYFEAENHFVYTAASSVEALEKLSYSPDIILLDINMPGMNGLELCSVIRNYISCPIIFLTARATEQDKINGLLAGGDDYVTKPFSIDELIARVIAHIRREERSHTRSKAKFIDGLVIDYGERKVFYKDQLIEFSNKEFEIVRLLSMNAGQVFDKETIYEKLWGLDGIGDSIVIKEHVRKIRTKMLVCTNIQFVETVWGVGYRWKK